MASHWLLASPQSFISHLELLGLPGQSVETFVALRIDSLFTRLRPGSGRAVRANLMEWNLAALQQLYQQGTRDIEHVSGLLGSEFGMDREDADRVALTNFGQDIHQQAQCRCRDADRVCGAIREGGHHAANGACIHRTMCGG